MEQGRVEDLKRIYGLFKLVEKKLPNPNFEDLRKRWRMYITEKGEVMLNDEELAKKESRAIEDFIEYR